MFAQTVGAWIVWSLFDPHWNDASVVLDLVAVAAIVGSVTAYNRLRTALVASEGAASAWHEERDAAVAARDRLAEYLTDLEEKKVALIAQVAALSERPDLTNLEALVAESTASMLRHETAAAARTERLIGAIEALPQAIVKRP
jgi:hypothetical protein